MLLELLLKEWWMFLATNKECLLFLTAIIKTYCYIYIVLFNPNHIWGGGNSSHTSLNTFLKIKKKKYLASSIQTINKIVKLCTH